MNAILRTQLDLAAATPLLLTALGAMAGGMALSRLARALFGAGYGFRIDLPVWIPLQFLHRARCGGPFGTPGIAALGLIIGLAVPLCQSFVGVDARRHGDTGVWREIGRNPLIWATLAGLLLNLAGFVPPKPAAIFLAVLPTPRSPSAACRRCRAAPAGAVRGAGRLTLPLGSQARGTAAAGDPAGEWLVCPEPIWASRSCSHRCRQRRRPTSWPCMGGDGRSVAWIISATTLVSMLTMPLWATWVAKAN